MNLRPYQSRIIEAARGMLKTHPVGCVVAPTGAGKTVIFTSIAQMTVAKGGNVLMLVNRENLMNQTSNTLSALKIRNAVIHRQNVRIDAPALLSTVQTFSKRFPHGIKASIIIVDECHIGIYDGYVKKLLAIPGNRVIGFTATPSRLNRKKPMHKVYKQFVQPAKTHELIEDGYLCPPSYHVTDLDLSSLETDKSGDYTDESQDKVFANIDSLINGLKEYGLGKGLIFCNRVKKSYEIAEQLTSVGIPAEAIEGKMSSAERGSLVGRLASGSLHYLVNADLLTFGFDMPALNTVCIYRATKSIALWHQMLGRGARTYQGKDRFNVLDFGGNVVRLGLWEEDIDWERHFFGEPPSDLTPAVKECKECGAYNVTSAKACKECGAEFSGGGAMPKPIIEVDATLKPYDATQRTPRHISVQELVLASRQFGYQESWIHHQLMRRDNPLQELTEYFTLTGKPDPSKSAAKVMERIQATSI